MKFYLVAVLAALLAACGGGGGSSSTQPATAAPSPTPSVSATFTTNITTNAGIYQMADGPDGRIWFSEFEGNQVGATTTAGVVTQYSTGANSQPNAIVAGPDGNMWSSGYGGGIYKITTSGTVTTYPLAGGHVQTLVVGSDGNLWFGDYGNKALGKITTAGTITEYPLPAGASPGTIAAGSDGNLWVSATPGNVNTLYKYSTSGTLLATYTSGLGPTAFITFMVTASDGNMYLGEYFDSATTGDAVARLTPSSGTIVQVGTLAPQTYPNNGAVGKDGNIYFTEYDRENLGKIAIPSGTVSETPLSVTSGDVISAIVNGPDNRLYLGGKSTIYAVSY